ncbi:hypothetical protein [uncultured Christiangramia sp.]|uniref:hypothetical protein n=1 Tax=Christiangramia sp. 3-2217-3z TaxID=3417564 RepID=UPI002637CE94|nr:hypothetical protein [uncultured Christiangramia sp.]
MNNKIEIFAPKFEGDRFTEHRLPLELLEDLTALQEMTIAMAKHLYLEKNQDRQRIPKNFTQGISFELESLEPGSTIPKIMLVFTMAGMFPHHNVSFFEEAKENIIKAVEAADNEGDINKYAPDSVLNYFNKFGKKLRQNESIEFNPHGSSKARFTKETRRKLILASSKSNEYTEEVKIRGTIFEMDQDKSTFQIQLVNNKKIESSYNDNNEETVKKAFNGYTSGQKVLIDGIGKFSKNSKLIRIESIEEINLIESTDTGYRLEELSLLKDGWLEGEGLSLDKNGIEWLSDKLDSNFNIEEIETYIFPTLDGNTQFEWSSDNWEVSLKVDLKERKGTLHKLNLRDDSDFEKSLDLNLEDSWVQLNKELQQTFGI